VETLVAVSFLGSGDHTAAARLAQEIRQDFSGLDDGFLQAVAARLAVPPEQRAAAVRAARFAARSAIAAGAHAGIAGIAITSMSYPPLLQKIVDPPPFLWLKGDPAGLSRPAVAVVGARAATPTGVRMGYQLGRDLAAAGLVVVSGLARGIDASAHLGALDAGGVTVAVLGSGIDRIYPPEHLGLADRIVDQGALVSELVPGAPPRAPHFPLRNRIISGLSRAVVVVEASEKSGTLITARAALDQGRDVLAVPGSVAGAQYRGCHGLIKDGARLVETVKDVLEEIRWTPPGAAAGAAASKPRQLSALERAMDLGEPYTVDDLLQRLGGTTSQILAQLTALELDGHITRVAAGGFLRLD
jgi:DNA processing protein